ncbi:MAG: twin-arginine translocase subunit TatC [Chloroflexota bacterium]|nr:twin-arginine translocase subunit TatC [Chloroflexota bacterium]MDE2885530.1 twin-arginine translocase subunit TatC [Chloroflexota bacterium]
MAASEMTLREHLEELRRRLIFVVVFVILAMIVAFVFRNPIFAFLLEPGFSQLDEKPIATEVLETVGVTFKVTLLVAFAASLPVVLYHVIMFASPGLTARERLYVFLFLPGVLIAFAAGVAFGYYVLFPPAFYFLFNFGSENVNPEIRIASYVNVITSLMFWMGVVFQIPLVLFGLGRLGVVGSRWLMRRWRFAVLLAFIAAAMITPTFDPVNQTLVAVPIIVLYLFGILLARLGERLRRGARAREERGPGLLRRVGRRLAFWRLPGYLWRKLFRRGRGEP